LAKEEFAGVDRALEVSPLRLAWRGKARARRDSDPVDIDSGREREKGRREGEGEEKKKEGGEGGGGLGRISSPPASARSSLRKRGGGPEPLEPEGTSKVTRPSSNFRNHLQSGTRSPRTTHSDGKGTNPVGV